MLNFQNYYIFFPVFEYIQIFKKWFKRPDGFYKIFKFKKSTKNHIVRSFPSKKKSECDGQVDKRASRLIWQVKQRWDAGLFPDVKIFYFQKFFYIFSKQKFFCSENQKFFLQINFLLTR